MAIKLVSRAEWGARPYRTPNGATRYSRPRRGVKIHYLGTPYTDRPHTACAAYVRKLQDSHMDGNGWSDIGYSFVVCTHGYVYEGRGLARRNSANGNTTLNEQDYAVCALVGSSGLTTPPPAQLHGLRDAVDYCREEGPAGDWLGGHRDGHATSCPGDPLYAWAHAGGPRPNSTTPGPKENDMPISDADADKIALRVLGYRNKNADEASVAATGRRIPDVYGYVTQTHAQTKADDSVDLTDAQLTRLADLVAARLGTNLADQVADKLAARLTD
ncbi:N-acetylmuramoyl-L-alanine amidase [Streptomyces sp. NPDC054975]